MAGAGDVEEHRRQRVAGEVVQLAGDASSFLGDGLLGERLPRPVELDDQGLLAMQQPSDREREGVGHDPRLPADVLLRRQELADDPRRRRGEGGDQRRPHGRLDVGRHVQDHRHAEEEHRFEHRLDADDDEDRDDDENREHLGKTGQAILEHEGGDGRGHDQQVERGAGIGELGDRRDHRDGDDEEAAIVTTQRDVLPMVVVSASRDVSSTTTRLRRRTVAAPSAHGPPTEPTPSTRGS